MRLGILTSWPLLGTTGSGVVTSIRGFGVGLDAHSVEVQFVAPVKRAPRTMTGTFTRRLWWNGALPRRIRNVKRSGRLDALLGFDFDGAYLEPQERPPLTVYCGGTLADILPFESGWAHRLLRTQARLEEQNVRLADRVVVPSAYARSAVVRHYGLDEDGVAVVPLAVDAAGWQAVRSVLPDPAPRSPVVLAVARCYRRKGLHLLVEAWRALSSRSGSGTLVIVGGGPQLGALRRAATRPGLKGRILLTGAISDPGMLKGWYQSADLFCLPSRHETFGLVFLEAALHSLPTLALRTTAVQEVVHDGVTGVLVPDRPDEEVVPQLAEAIEHLLVHDEERLALGQAARDAASGRTWTDAAGELIRLLA